MSQKKAVAPLSHAVNGMIDIGSNDQHWVLNLSVTNWPCCEMDCKFSCSDISSLRLGFVSTCLTCYAKIKKHQSLNNLVPEEFFEITR